MSTGEGRMFAADERGDRVETAMRKKGGSWTASVLDGNGEVALELETRLDTEASALKALRREVGDQYRRRLALIDAAIAEVGK